MKTFSRRFLDRHHKFHTLGEGMKTANLSRLFAATIALAAATALLAAPAAVRAQTLYVSSGSQTIDQVSSTGTVSLFASLPANSFPRGVAFDGSGNLYVVDAGTDQISKITPGGAVSLFATLPGFSNSVGVAFDGSGNLYTTSENSNINRILQITPGGTVTTFATPPNGSLLDGLAFDGSGNLYAAEQTNDQIDKITSGGAVSLFATLPGGSGPDGLAFDASGNLYAAGNPNKVYKISPDGLTVSIFANLPSGSGPFGLAFDGSGNLYVADGASGQISKISPDGLTVTPFATGIDQPRFIAIAGATPLALTTAVSRKVHGGGGIFDIPLPLTGEPGVECRSSGGAHTLVFTFSNNVVSGNASVTTGIGSVLGGPTFSGNTMTVNLTGVTDVQKITVTLSNVTDSFAQVLPNTPVSVNMLIGDTTGNKTVSASDIAQTKGQSGVTVTAANFRNDINANGTVSASDIAQVKANAGHTLP